MFFDPLYLLLMVPAMLLAGWAQMKVHSALNEGHKVLAASRMTGAEAARRILDADGLTNVGIEAARGMLGDHYDPRAKVLRLTPDVYNGRSLSALGVAAHEAGHALQDAKGYAPLAVRNFIVPAASFGSSMSWIFIMFGFLLQSFNFILFGIVLFSIAVVFQLVNLPVEFDASKRAKELLVARGFISPAELTVVSKVLTAAAMTYVAATITAVLQLLYFVIRAQSMRN